jgi:hypothetical protein
MSLLQHRHSQHTNVLSSDSIPDSESGGTPSTPKHAFTSWPTHKVIPGNQPGLHSKSSNAHDYHAQPMLELQQLQYAQYSSIMMHDITNTPYHYPVTWQEQTANVSSASDTQARANGPEHKHVHPEQPDELPVVSGRSPIMPRMASPRTSRHSPPGTHSMMVPWLINNRSSSNVNTTCDSPSS